MAKKLSSASELELARKFFEHVFSATEDLDDTIYELLDPACKYGAELCDRFNVDLIQEVIALGFKQKYGEEWRTVSKVPPADRKRWCSHCTTDCPERGKDCP